MKAKSVKRLGIISIILCASTFMILPSITCAPQKPPDDVPGGTYVVPSDAGPITIEGVRYKYVAGSDREKQIRLGYPSLSLGQNRKRVRQILGPPDSTMPLNSGPFAFKFRGWSYMYYINMRENGPNMNDVCVELFFDPAGNLHWAVPEHLVGLNEIGHP